jgi:formylglycine-generating enzyme required for sulfatase activity
MQTPERTRITLLAILALLTPACAPLPPDAPTPRATESPPAGMTVEKLRGTTPEGSQPHILRLFLQPDTLTLAPHEPRALKVLATLSDGRLVEIVNHNKINWKVENPSVASVLGNTIKAESIGETLLTATVANQSASAQLRVRTSEGGATTARVQTLTVASDSYTLAVGQTLNLAVQAYMSDGSTNQDLLYTTDRGDRISLNAETGQITRLTPGEATVTVYARQDARQFKVLRILDAVTAGPSAPPVLATQAPPAVLTPELWVPQTRYMLAPDESVQIRAELRFSDGSRSAALDYKLEPADAFELNPLTGVIRRLKAGLGQLTVRARGYDIQERITLAERTVTASVTPVPAISPTVTPVPANSPTPIPLPTPTPTPDGTFTNSLGMRFVAIAPGTFWMGSPPDEPDRMENETRHQVTLTKGYYLQTTEVTQAQWKAVMGNNPSQFKGDTLPVESVPMSEIEYFIQLLNQRGEGTYRLPTEAEWEYAARAGTTTRWSCGDNESCLDQVAWYIVNANNKNHPVAQKQPNAWGLYDMHGNVWEWVQDFYTDYPSGPVTDPQGPSSGMYRTMRGGAQAFNANASHLRAAYRNYYLSPEFRLAYTGFRLVCEP